MIIDTLGVVISTFLPSRVESAVAALPNVIFPISPKASCSNGVKKSSTDFVCGAKDPSADCLRRASISSWDK
ncbi:hypothetical protein D3C87_1805320 [compost metagenome]